MLSKQCGSRSPKPFHLTGLPEVPLDKVISYLTDEDLRRFHQVSKSWKAALESRRKEDNRRKELASRIRENKENIRNGSHTPQEPVPLAMAQLAIRERSSSVVLQDGKKTGNSFILMECTNQVDTNTPTSVITTSSVVSTPADATNFQTPNSRFEFQEFQKAEKSLEEGQKLLQCRRCRGPVPSPVTPGVSFQEVHQESRRLSSQSTRCKLISRMDDYHQTPQPDSPRKPESKKAKTLSIASLSPIPYLPSVTVASLEEKINRSFFLSSPCLTTTSNTATTVLPSPSSPEVNYVKRSTSCSSIDLPHHPLTAEIDSPTELSVNLSNLGDSPFYTSHLSNRHHQFGTFVDLNGSSLSCSRSCCSPRRISNNNSQLHTSHFSDSGLSFEGDSIDEFRNVVFSPTEIPAAAARRTSDRGSNRNSIEQTRDFGNYSDGAISLSSYTHLQRSDHSLNFSNYDANIESVFASVLECPNPKCGYRFCSNCEESEHPGRQCRMVSSDQFESFSLECNNNNISNSFGVETIMISNSSINSHDNSNNNKSSSNKKSSKQKKQRKTQLRRLTKL